MTFARLRSLPDQDHLPALDAAYLSALPARGLDPTDPAPRILLLYGSLRERSFSRLCVEEAARLLQRMGCETRIFDPSDLPLPGAPGDDDHPAVRELREHALWSEGMVLLPHRAGPRPPPSRPARETSLDLFMRSATGRRRTFSSGVAEVHIRRSPGIERSTMERSHAQGRHPRARVVISGMRLSLRAGGANPINTVAAAASASPQSASSSISRAVQKDKTPRKTLAN